MKEELERIPANARAPFDAVYALYANLPTFPEAFVIPKLLTSLRSGMTGGPIVRDEMLGRLERILPHDFDRRHIYQAAKNGLDYFVTRDSKSILKHAERLRAEVGIIACLPSELVARLRR